LCKNSSFEFPVPEVDSLVPYRRATGVRYLFLSRFRCTANQPKCLFSPPLLVRDPSIIGPLCTPHLDRASQDLNTPFFMTPRFPRPLFSWGTRARDHLARRPPSQKSAWFFLPLPTIFLGPARDFPWFRFSQWGYGGYSLVRRRFAFPCLFSPPVSLTSIFPVRSD